MDHTLPVLDCGVKVVMQGERALHHPKHGWSVQDSEHQEPWVQIKSPSALWELPARVGIVLWLNCWVAQGVLCLTTGEGMAWHFRQAHRAVSHMVWWELPRRNEGDFACGSKRIAWIEYVAGNWVYFNHIKLFNLGKTLAKFWSPLFFPSYCGSWAELPSSSFS